MMMKRSIETGVTAALLYGLGLLSIAPLGVIVPLTNAIVRDLATASTSAGFALSLFALPGALCTLWAGSLVDRIGIRPMLWVGGIGEVLGDATIASASSVAQLYCGMAILGIGYAAFITAIPTIYIHVFSGSLRTSLMAFWPTRSPAGFALGLLFAVPFVLSLGWREAFAAHGAIALAIQAAVMVLLAGRLDKANGPPVHRGSAIQVIKDGHVVRLALAFAFADLVTYGTTLVAAGYAARVHGLSMASSASTIAVAKIVVIIFGAAAVAALLARANGYRRLYVQIASLGIAAQFLFFYPSLPFAVAIAGLLIWLFAFSGMAGVCMGDMVRLSDAGRPTGAMTGLVHQLGAISAVIAPPIYFGVAHWPVFILLALACLGLGIVLYPAQAQPGGAYPLR